jgi:class 3 adenylate cyclase
MAIVGKGQAREDPRVCNSCVKQGQRHPGGAHVDVATVFADMRGSTPTAERIGDRAFSELIDRFSKTSSKILIDAGAIVDRLAGDRAIGYFVPGFAGPT